MRVILCGPPMSGKSHFGKRAAEHLKLPFIDVDLLIEQANSMTCRDMALTYGDFVFRQKEQEAILGLSQKINAVIAIGGGALEKSENANHLKRIGTLIYLQTPISKLLERLRVRKKTYSYLNIEDPESHFCELIKKRSKNYETYADYIINTALQSEETILEAICKIGGNCGKQ